MNVSFTWQPYQLSLNWQCFTKTSQKSQIACPPTVSSRLCVFFQSHHNLIVLSRFHINILKLSFPRFTSPTNPQNSQLFHAHNWWREFSKTHAFERRWETQQKSGKVFSRERNSWLGKSPACGSFLKSKSKVPESDNETKIKVYCHTFAGADV